ncbi:hypothetical protein ABNG02_15665 [Halorubrum ejinorense]|uniref:Uncharacterized protein n=1 Tax=Halorubrum ejinorense TaxID=425309 RepID=A0AAV3SQ46_9EURY
MKFRKAIIVFEDDDWDEGPNKHPHSEVEIHENGWVSAEVIEEDTDSKTTAYYSPDKVHAVYPE